MLFAQDPLAALEHASAERQGPHRLHALGQIVHAGERVRMLLAQQPLAALERAPVERKGPRRTALGRSSPTCESDKTAVSIIGNSEKDTSN